MQWHTEWAFLNSLKHQWLSVLLQQSVNKVNSNGKKKISLNIIMQNCLKKYFLVIVKRHTNFIVKQNTMWHKIFVGGYFCRLAIFCVLRELIFAIRTDWFFLLRVNFCDFQKVFSTQHWSYRFNNNNNLFIYSALFNMLGDQKRITTINNLKTMQK